MLSVSMVPVDVPASSHLFSIALGSNIFLQLSRFLRGLVGVVSILLITAICLLGQSSVVISQVYGGGGNSGATFRNDYVELFNRGRAAVVINGWTVQHASANGSNWDRAFVSGTIQPGGYYLLQLAQGNAGTVNLPTPDATAGMNVSAMSAKLVLVNNSTLLTGSAPAGQIMDFVGYGSTNTTEGNAAPTLSNTTAIFRRGGGCNDSNNNGADFVVGLPVPRNSASPLAPCFIEASPLISAAGVVNAASFEGGAIAPGQVLTIFGSNLGPNQLATLELTADQQSISKSIGGTRVLFDGAASPILYSVAGQVSAIAPFGLAGRRSVEMQVEYNGRASNRITMEVQPAAPGIFTMDASGRGLGAILNSDYQANGASRPAQRGGVIILYATGAGQTDPGSTDGRIVAGIGRQVQPMELKIAGVDAEILYAGPAPGLVSGVVQVNARIPFGIPTGMVLIELSSGGRASKNGVRVAVGEE